MRRAIVAYLLFIAASCGSPPAEDGGAGGSEVCTWCADEAPYVRACAETMIASGGQLVCVDDGEDRLCEAPSECRATRDP